MKAGIVSYGGYLPRYRIRPKDIGVVWGAAVLWSIAHLATVPRALVIVSLAFPVYYVGLSLALHVRRP